MIKFREISARMENTANSDFLILCIFATQCGRYFKPSILLYQINIRLQRYRDYKIDEAMSKGFLFLSDTLIAVTTGCP